MTKQQLQSLFNGGLIARFNSIYLAEARATNQPCYTAVLLGCDGRYWVPATPRIGRELAQAGYEEAPTAKDRDLAAVRRELEDAKALYRAVADELARTKDEARTLRGELEEARRCR
ncbi:MAG: hypothetical protein JST38_10885 [Bacteroidetes bacterium]|nr:hypothetical protein [Bacteroidota bacterium]